MDDPVLLKLLVAALIALPVYYLLPRRAQNVWLLLVSTAFYLTWSFGFVAVLVAVALVNFVLAQEIAAASRWRRALLWAGIGLNVVCVAFFKYPTFFLRKGVFGYFQSAAGLVGLPVDSAASILLPVGLSFVMLQMISYLLDVERERIAPAADLIDFSLYVAYFPKLISGPIERAGPFLASLAEPRVVDNERLVNGFARIAIGLFRKVALAGPLFAVLPDDLFQTPGAYGGFQLAVWLVAYAFALYNDFAGYTSLARGISGLMGIELSENFRQPYFAHSFVEFWNRWHISFSHWLRDYLYLPITRALLRRSRGKVNALNAVLPSLITMLLSGLWHGATWPLLIWGGLHGLFQSVERLLGLAFKKPSPSLPPSMWRQAGGMLLTATLAILAWIPFRMGLPESLAYVRGLLQWGGSFGLDARVIILLGPAILLDLIQERGGELGMVRWPLLARSAALAVCILALLIVLRAEMTVAPFVYQLF